MNPEQTPSLCWILDLWIQHQKHHEHQTCSQCLLPFVLDRSSHHHDNRCRDCDSWVDYSGIQWKEMPMEIAFWSKQEGDVGRFGTAASNGTDSKRADFRLVGYLTLPYWLLTTVSVFLCYYYCFVLAASWAGCRRLSTWRDGTFGGCRRGHELVNETMDPRANHGFSE